MKQYLDNIACDYDKWKNKTKFYHDSLTAIYKSVVPEKSRVLDFSCATGDLLHALNPSFGVGISISSEMIEIAKKKYPQLKFIEGRVDNTYSSDFKNKFDYIILSNLVDYLPDVSETFSKMREFLAEGGLIIVTAENPIWSPLMKLASKLKIRMPDISRNFLAISDLTNLVRLADLEVIKSGLKFFIPVKIPLVSSLINFIMAEIPLLRNLCLIQYMLIRYPVKREPLTCSIIVPCHNEIDNIENCVRRIPKIGVFTEIIIVDDGSTDGTKYRVEKLLKDSNNLRLITYDKNKGKGFAVKSGFDAATCDVLMILDADMAVMPEDLPKFFIPIQEGKADFINGTRLVYPMKDQAMRTLNYLGNRIFNLILSWLIEQRISDTLCGTKAIFKKDYCNITMGRCKWGDFDLLLGIAKLKKKILEVPIHYQKRIAGRSKMKVIRHGMLLAKMCCIGFVELKLGINQKTRKKVE